ncbi:putative nucleotidyltransferase, Ribonuclease H [Helianthus annuus]|nr:putative nucleotidyltransferase, Ribonuclease H [Helianthus annuus]
MYFISGLPKSQGKEVIFVVVDRLTKYSHFMALSHPFTAAQVAQLFLDNVYKLHGWPSTITSDRDPIFLSHFWKEFTRLQGVSLALSTAYHPQSDGQTEVVNRCVETYLRCMTMERPSSWMKWLSLAEFWYNTNYHTATHKTPFQALYGYAPPLHVPYVHRDSMVAAVDDFMIRREETIRLLKQSLEKAQNRLRQQANKHRSDRVFAVGDWVFLKLQNYVQSSIRGHAYSKLSPKYYGPYLVVQKVGAVAYKLDLPDDANIHPTFHVSLLKKATGPPTTIIHIPKGHRFSLKPEKVLESRVVRRGNRAAGQVLIKWNGLPDSDATWEFRDELQLRFPDFQMDDL